MCTPYKRTTYHIHTMRVCIHISRDIPRRYTQIGNLIYKYILPRPLLCIVRIKMCFCVSCVHHVCSSTVCMKQTSIVDDKRTSRLRRRRRRRKAAPMLKVKKSVHSCVMRMWWQQRGGGASRILREHASLCVYCIYVCMWLVCCFSKYFFSFFPCCAVHKCAQVKNWELYIIILSTKPRGHIPCIFTCVLSLFLSSSCAARAA